MTVFIIDIEEIKSRTVVAKAETLEQAVDKVRSGTGFAVLYESPVSMVKVIKHKHKEAE